MGQDGAGHGALRRGQEAVAWTRRTLVDMTRPGDKHDLERILRHFALTLARLKEARAALREAAREVGAVTWLDAFEVATRGDPLLRYLLLAPDLHGDDTLLTWPRTIETFDMRVVNDRAIRFNDRSELMHYVFRCTSDAQLFDKVARGAMPSIRRLRKAGAELLVDYDGLALRSYDIRGVARIEPPRRHLSMALGGTARAALEDAVRWFEDEAGVLARIVGGTP
ncbi:MAG: hypothetical protein U1E62_05190 [Alsobacter sp.]